MLIAGRVQDSTDHSPLAYVNIGIADSKFGTLSNEDGSFSMSITDSYSKDTVRFSALGFANKEMAVKAFMDNSNVVVYLHEKDILLQAVTIEAKREKRATFEFGNRFFKGGVNLTSAEGSSAGAAVALLIDDAYPSYKKDFKFPAFVEQARVRIGNNSRDEFKIRVRLYSVDSLTGLPGTDLLTQSMIVHSKIKQGWLDIDLSQYKVVVTGPFFIAFEWILNQDERTIIQNQYREFERLHPERTKIDTTIVAGGKIATLNYGNFLPGTSFGVSLIPFSIDHFKCYGRINSLGKWERAAYILSARVTVSR